MATKIKINLENKFLGLKSKENIKSKTIATKSWINNSDKKAFIQDLKIIDVCSRSIKRKTNICFWLFR